MRRTQTELVIATLDKAQTLRHRTGMVCMMTVPLTALVGAGQSREMVGAGLRLDGQVLFA